MYEGFGVGFGDSDSAYRVHDRRSSIKHAASRSPPPACRASPIAGRAQRHTWGGGRSRGNPGGQNPADECHTPKREVKLFTRSHLWRCAWPRGGASAARPPDAQSFSPSRSQYLVIPGAARGGANYASLELGCAVTTRTERELSAVTATAHDQRLRRIPWRTNTDSGVDLPTAKVTLTK